MPLSHVRMGFFYPIVQNCDQPNLAPAREKAAFATFVLVLKYDWHGLPGAASNNSLPSLIILKLRSTHFLLEGALCSGFVCLRHTIMIFVAFPYFLRTKDVLT